MPIDPLAWAMTPGMGRAPTLGQTPAASVTQNPREDLARLMLQQQTGSEGRTLPGDMPVGSLARNPVGVPPDALRAELVAGGGLDPGMAQNALVSAPGAVAGLLSGLGPLGTAMGSMGRAGQRQQMRDVSRELSHERLQAKPGTQMAAALGDDPYERGQRAARTLLARNQGGNGGGRDRSSDMASPGLSRSDDPDVGWGGA